MFWNLDIFITFDEFAPGNMLEEKLADRFSRFEICVPKKYWKWPETYKPILHSYWTP